MKSCLLLNCESGGSVPFIPCLRQSQNDELVIFNCESLTVSLYHSGCREDEVHIEGKLYVCTAILT